MAGLAIQVEELSSRFEGKFKFRGRTETVPFALPGDHVQFRMIKRGRSRKIEVLHIEKASEYSPEYQVREPFCPYYGRCGGCRAQHLGYEAQLRIKTAPIAAEMKRHFGLETTILPAPSERGYRNRMDFVLDSGILGLRPAGDFSSFIDIESCAIQKPAANEALRLIRSLLLKYPGVGFSRKLQTETNSSQTETNSSQDETGSSQAETGNPQAETGSPQAGPLKYVTIRSGHESGAIVLTAAPELIEGSQAYGAFCEELQRELAEGEIAGLKYSLIETLTGSSSELSCTPGGRALHGPDTYVEKLGGMEFTVPYDSFFQPNPEAFDRLLEWALAQLRESLPGQEPGGLLDLYSGAGILSAVTARAFPGAFSSIAGYDFVASSAARAPANLAQYQGEIDFRAQDLNRPDPELLRKRPLRLIIIDPPRAGMSPGLCQLLREERLAPHILYISCNPDTQIKDMKELLPAYAPTSACIMDCFAETPHLEQAVLLQRQQ